MCRGSFISSMKEKRNVLYNVNLKSYFDEVVGNPERSCLDFREPLFSMVLLYLENVAKICHTPKENLKNLSEYLGNLKEC